MTSERTFITINELAERLDVTTRTIRKWARTGKMPDDCYIVIAGTYRFDYDAILRTFRPNHEQRPEQLTLDFGGGEKATK